MSMPYDCLFVIYPEINVAPDFRQRAFIMCPATTAWTVDIKIEHD